MKLAYRGANFHGWQSQPNAVSVQSTIEDALTTIMRTPIKITGAGRTDTGVNARMMIAHFDVEQPLPSHDGLVKALNSLVGKDIAIYSISPVHDDAHARFDATSRTYHYHVYTGKIPFLRHYAMRLHFHPDFVAMNAAAAQ